MFSLKKKNYAYVERELALEEAMNEVKWLKFFCC